VLLLLVLPLTGCKRQDDERGEAPPPASSAKPGVCAGGGGTPGDPVSVAFFPRQVGEYCVDPNGDTRAYGRDAKNTLDDVCIQQLDGECEVYKSYGLRRVVTLRYADGGGSPAQVSVTLSEFGAKEGAYGFFTKRVVADGDPAQITLAELPAGGAGALGSGIAYVWRGQHVLELAYTNESESPDQMRQSGKRLLPPIARAIGDRLPGDTELPGAVALLPTAHRLKMGVVYAFADLLGISGLGGGAIGFYQDGENRYRIFALGRADDAAASDVLETLKKVDRATTVKDLGFPAVTFGLQRDDAAPRTEWLVGRRGKQVFGVGDDELAESGAHSKEAEARVNLGRDEKVALLRHLVSGS
jgi:hypothetical protein